MHIKLNSLAALWGIACWLPSIVVYAEDYPLHIRVANPQGVCWQTGADFGLEKLMESPHHYTHYCMSQEELNLLITTRELILWEARLSAKQEE